MHHQPTNCKPTLLKDDGHMHVFSFILVHNWSHCYIFIHFLHTTVVLCFKYITFPAIRVGSYGSNTIEFPSYVANLFILYDR